MQEMIAQVVDGAVARPSGTGEERGPVGVRVRNVHEPRHQRAIAERQIARLGADRAGGSRLAVVATHEADHDRAPRRAAHEPDGRLDRLGAVQRDVHSAQARRRDREQALRKREEVLVREVMGVLVAVAPKRLDRGFEEILTPGTERHRRHGAHEVEVEVAVDVLDLVARLPADDEGADLVRQPRVEDAFLAFEDLARLRSRRRRHDPGRPQRLRQPETSARHLVRHLRPRRASRRISRAAFRPFAPVTPPPGCVPAPHR